MDFFPAILASLVLLIMTLVFLSLHTLSSVKKFPPGPRKLPIIGHLHYISAHPFRSFRDMAKKYGPIMHLKVGEVSAIVVSSPEIAKVVLKDLDPCFAERFGSIAIKIMWRDYTDIAFCEYSDYWRQMRKICVVEMMSAKTVRSFGYIRAEEVSHLLQSFKSSDGRPMNFTEQIFSMTSSITCRVAFGKVCKDTATLISLVKQSFAMGGGFFVADLFPSSKILNNLSWGKSEIMKMRCKLDVILDEIIDEHKVNLAKLREFEDGKDNSKKRGNGELGNEDLVDVLLRVKENKELKFSINNDNIKSILFDMFAGGTETSSVTLDWTMTELIRNPRVMKKVQAEVREVFKGCKVIEENDVQKLKYLKLVIKESLRLHPPSPFVPRACREETTINGYTIPVKARVLINIWAIHRDPKYWTNPESFEPERFENSSIDFVGGDYEYLPFGSGQRMCPGIKYGLADMELPLALLLYHFDWKLPDGVNPDELNMIENVGLSASRKDNLYIVASPYEPLS